MRKENLKILFIIVLAFVLRLVNLYQSLWLDEAAQIIESSRPLIQQFDLAADFHPPLYHVLLHFWLHLGKSEIWVRLLSVGFGLGSVYLIYKIGKLLTSQKVAIVSTLFLTISPYHIWYSQETRPYMAFVFFSLLSTFLLLNKKWVWFTLALIFTLYTHYFTLFMIIGYSVYVLLFEKKYLKKFLVSLAISLLTFGLWLPEFLKQLTVGTSGFFTGWTDVVSVSPIKTAALTFAKFIFGRGTIDNNFLYAIIILPVFLLFILSLTKIWKEKEGKILAILFFAPFLISEIVSLLAPINAPQRLIFLLPIFYIIMAVGIYRLAEKIRIIAISAVILTSLGGIYQYYTDSNVQREQWREAVAFTEKEKDSQSVALFVFPEPFAPYLWYKKDKIEAWGIAPKFVVTEEDLNLLMPKLENKNRLFLYQYLTGLTDPQSKTRQFLSARGFRLTDTKNFPGVGFIYIYDKK